MQGILRYLSSIVDVVLLSVCRLSCLLITSDVVVIVTNTIAIPLYSLFQENLISLMS